MPFFSVQGTFTLYVITSRMYSGLSCLEGLPYNNVRNVVFDLELAETLPIIIVMVAMEVICT